MAFRIKMELCYWGWRPVFLLPCLCELFCYGWQGIRAQDGQMPAAVGELKQCSLCKEESPSLAQLLWLQVHPFLDVRATL